VTAKKTLTLRAPSERGDAPALQKKGRGWAIAESRLDKIHDSAREMRRHPTPAQTALADELAKADLGRFRFRRQQVIGSAIVDFACPPMKLAVELVEDGADTALEQRRDASLAAVGVKVLRYPAADALADPAALTHRIIDEMKARWAELRPARPPRRSYARPRQG
jgi:very-short-patch-repair endonuclease